jgi:hypothetical protein
MRQPFKPYTIELSLRNFDEVWISSFQLLIIPNLHISLSSSWNVDFICVWLDAGVGIYQPMQPPEWKTPKNK